MIITPQGARKERLMSGETQLRALLKLRKQVLDADSVQLQGTKRGIAC